MKEIKDTGTKACITIKRYRECAHRAGVPMTTCQGGLGWEPYHHSKTNLTPDCPRGRRRRFRDTKQNFRRRPTSAAAPTEARGRGGTDTQLQREIREMVQAEVKAMIGPLTKELLDRFGREAQQVLRDVVSDALKEMGGTAATAAAQAATTAAQSAQKTWANVAAAGTHRQLPDGGAGEPRLVIPARHNREALVHPDPDTLPASSTPNETVDAINRTLQNSKAVVIRRLKSGSVVVTFKEGATEYKKGENWITEVFGASATHACREIVVLAKGLPNRDITRAYTDPEGLFDNLKRRNTPSITRVKLRRTQKDAIYGILIINCSSAQAAQKLCIEGLLWEA